MDSPDGLEEQRGLFSRHVVFMHGFEMHRDHEPPEERDELKFFDVSCVQPVDDVSDAALLQMLSQTTLSACYINLLHGGRYADLV